MSSDRERLEALERWWSGGFPGAFPAEGDPLEERLRLAFQRVLLAMGEEDFAYFLAANPTVICLPQVTGMALTYELTLPAGASRVTFRILYFAAGICRRRTDEGLAAVVAHEVAHLVRRHHDRRGTAVQEVEKDAESDALAVQWGFRRSYSVAQMRKMRELVAGGTSWPPPFSV